MCHHSLKYGRGNCEEKFTRKSARSYEATERKTIVDYRRAIAEHEESQNINVINVENSLAVM